jgi:RNA polymerase sigma factor for flagellar operon FliA
LILGTATSGGFLAHFQRSEPYQEVLVSQRKTKRIDGRVPRLARASPDELVERHLNLVIHVARDFQQRVPPSVTFGDLVGAGNLGLVEAARRFNPAKGVPFPAFARHRIRGAITDSLRRLDPLSRRLRSFQRAAQEAADRLTVTLGRAPSDAEVAAHIGLTVNRFEGLSRELHEAGYTVNGLAPTTTAEVEVDQLPAGCDDPERMAEWTELRATMNGALRTLPCRHQTVIRWYHFEGWTMKRIAARLGIGESRVSQIHSIAIRQLREHAGLRKLA